MQGSFDDRRATFVVGAVLAVLASALTVIAWDGLAAFAANLATRHTVEVRTGAAAASIAAVQLWLLVAILSIGKKPGSSRLFRIILWLLPLLVMFPLAFLVVTNVMLPKIGYTRCDPQSGQRYLTAMWVRAGTDCPRGDTDKPLAGPY